MRILKLNFFSNSLYFKSLLATLGFALFNVVAYAECDPVNDPGCDIDLPIDNHVWILLIITIITAVFYFRRKPVIK